MSSAIRFMGRSTPKSNLTNLPFDLVHEVAGYLDTKADILRLALSSNYLFLALSSALYADVQLDNMEQCHSTLTMLIRRPDIACHVRKLLVRFLPTSRVHSLDINGFTVSSLVRRLAPALDALHTFIWDAEEIPQHDDMWFTLRVSCPRLTTIGTSYGAELPECHSHLFHFKGLRGFIFNVKRGYYERFSDMEIQEYRAESRLWDMLIRRSPNLEELHITGAPFASVSAIRPLCYARWPRLHTLSLGDILLDWDPLPSVKPPFITFLEAHPRLRFLRTSRAALNPALLSSLEPGSLPELTHFSGAIEHLQGLAAIHHQISSVALDEPLVIRDLAPLLLAGVLRGLRSLTELRVRFVFQSAYEGGSLIRSIAHACPGLTKLEVTCVRRSSFTIDTLVKAIRSLPRLQHLRVTLVRSQHEDPLAVCAATVAHTIPRLRTFSITFIPPDLPLLAYSASEIARTKGDPGHPYSETGNYILRTDEHGLPISVMCTEHRPRSSLASYLGSFPFPFLIPYISLGSAAHTANWKLRRYRYTLDLVRGARKRSGLGLFFEKSAAGEETRVLVALMSLSGLALWGFFS